MKNYLRNQLNHDDNHIEFPYLGFIMDHNGIEHDFGITLESDRCPENLNDYRHAPAMKEKFKEIIPNVILNTEHSDNLLYITNEISSYNFIVYLNFSGVMEKISDGMLEVGLSPTLKQRAVLREYDKFFQQHVEFPICRPINELEFEEYHMDIEEFLELLYETEDFSR